MIPLYNFDISQSTQKAIQKILQSGQLSSGKYVDELERHMRMITKTTYALAVNSGTAALHASLAAYDIGPSDEVIVPNFTFIATAHAVMMVGATPVFADISCTDYNLDLKSVENAITTKTKAIIAVNLYGQPAQYRQLKSLAHKYNLIIIEDAAQSIGASDNNKPSGSLGDISCFSFYATKNVMGGEGGMITTNNDRAAKFIEQFRNHGRDKIIGYSHTALGYNYRLSNLHACLALASLKKVTRNTKKRQAIANRYAQEITNQNLILPKTHAKRTHVFHQFVLRVDPKKPELRDKIVSKLIHNGVSSGIYYPQPLTNYPHLKKYQRAYLPTPNADIAAQTVFSIPIHPKLSRAEVSKVISEVNACQ